MSTVQAAKNAEVKEKRCIVWDVAPKGFGLRIDVDGSKIHLLKHVFDPVRSSRSHTTSV